MHSMVDQAALRGALRQDAHVLNVYSRFFLDQSITYTRTTEKPTMQRSRSNRATVPMVTYIA